MLGRVFALLSGVFGALDVAAKTYDRAKRFARVLFGKSTAPPHVDRQTTMRPPPKA